jgi:hypothetical protein
LAIEKFADLPHLEISSARHAADFIDEALALASGGLKNREPYVTVARRFSG